MPRDWAEENCRSWLSEFLGSSSRSLIEIAMPDDDDDDEDRPRAYRRRDEDDDDEDGVDDRPRRRRRRRRNDDDDYDSDEGLQYVIPINTSGLAIAAGYMGLISVLCLPAPIALILGILALNQLKKNPKMHGKGRAIFAIIMGGLFTLAMIGFGILAIIQGK